MEQVYVKLIDGELQFPPINNGEVLNYNLDIDRLIADGYKPFVPAEIPETNRMYHFEFTETAENVVEVVVYDETQEEADAREYRVREEEFHNEFFNTSLGYIRRSVTMNNGDHKDFLSDLLPTIALAVNSGRTVTVIAYNEPDFSHDVEDWTQYQHVEAATLLFINNCFEQLQNDFIPQS